MSNLTKAFLVSALIIILDQILKFWIKTHMYIGEAVPILGNWFIIQFTENNGMAFGMEFGGEFGKMFLTIFRIIAAIGITWYIVDLSKKKAHFGLLISLALILAGALGNIIDSAFYGLIFSESGYFSAQIAKFLPTEGGYSSFLHGKVVDMLYFPILKGHFPSWFPFWKNEYFEFFRPIFNIADSAITTGVFIIIIFQKKFFRKEDAEIAPIVQTSEPTVIQ